MKLLIINNLASGCGDGAIYDYVRAFIGNGDDVVIRSTDGERDIESMLEDASDFDCVVSAGGDGTAAAVSHAMIGNQVPILVYPSGTANLLAQNLRLPQEAHALAKATRDMLSLDFDLGQIIVEGQKLGFSIMAGAGYDALIMREARPFKMTMGAAAYFSAALANLTPQMTHFTITLDDEQTIESDGIGILLINFSEIQFELSLTHDNQPRDGKLMVAVLKSRNVLELAPILQAALLDLDGSHPDRSDAFQQFKCSKVRVSADPAIMLEYDGESTQYTTPFEASVIPSAVRYIVTEQGYSAFSD